MLVLLVGPATDGHVVKVIVLPVVSVGGELGLEEVLLQVGDLGVLGVDLGEGALQTTLQLGHVARLGI